MAILNRIKTLEEYSKKWLILQYLCMAFIPSIALLYILFPNTFNPILSPFILDVFASGCCFFSTFIFYIFLLVTVIVAFKTKCKPTYSKIMLGVIITIIICSAILYFCNIDSINVYRAYEEYEKYYLTIHICIALATFPIGFLFVIYTFISVIVTRFKTIHSVLLFGLGIINIAMIIALLNSL